MIADELRELRDALDTIANIADLATDDVGGELGDEMKTKALQAYTQACLQLTRVRERLEKT